MKKIKILYVIPRLAKAGTEKHILDLATFLNKNNFTISVCCLFEIGESDKDFNKLGFQIICLHRKNTYDLRIIYDLYKLFRKEKYDIIHSYLFGFHYLATIPAKIAGISLKISSRRELATWKKLHHHFLEHLGNLFTDKVVACSNAVKDYTLRTEYLPKDKISTIYNGIDLEKFKPRVKNIEIIRQFRLSEQDKIIGMVANFSAIKDHKTLLKGINKVIKSYPQIKCVLIGDGPLRNDIESRVIDLGLQKNIIFTGRRDDIAEILSIMDIFILTSQMEGLPNVILEAMACGLPLVATNVGGIPEAVENGKGGILLEPKDSQGIANAIITLLENKNLRKVMGNRSREIIEQKFGLDKMIRNYENLYIRTTEDINNG